MDVERVVELVQRVAAGPIDSSRAGLAVAAAEVRRLRSWVEAQEVRLAALAESTVSCPAQFLAEAGGSLRDAEAVLARVATVRAVPGLLLALSSGAVAGEHLVVMGRRLQRLEPAVRSRVLDDAAGLAAAAAARSPERFSAFVGERVRLAQREVGRDDGTTRLQAQQAMVGLSWRLAAEGMHEWRLLLDPVSAVAFDQAVAAEVETLFHDKVPPGCPTNPLQRQAFLRAHAMLSLARGGGGRAGRPEFIVVVDARDADSGEARAGDRDAGCGPAECAMAGSAPAGAAPGGSVPGSSASDGSVRDGSAPDGSVPAGDGPAGADGQGLGGRRDGEYVVDWGLPVEVPQRVLAELFGRADVHTVVVRNGVVLHAPGNVRLGRTTRLANRAQRRALRAIHPTCGVPGCAVRFGQCSIHHVHWWRNGGRTDLENLLPVCTQHHHLIHEGGWVLTLLPDRPIVVALPDGTEMSTGPPRRRAA